jgi:phage-related baseplate assembly protein
MSTSIGSGEELFLYGGPQEIDLQFATLSAEEIYKIIITELESGVNEPLYPGDERRIYAEALVPLFVATLNALNDAARQKMLRYARAEVLDALGERMDVQRQDAVAAKTILRFSLTAAIGETVIIPQGTRATADYVRYFATDTTAVLVAGTTSVEVPATSTVGGFDCNGIAAGEITILVDLIPYIDGVTNTEETHGGSDLEDDDTYRERIRLAPAKLSTAGPIDSYRYWALSADPTISDVVVESPAAGTIMITPILYGGEIPGKDILDRVLAVCNAEDVRPLGDKVQVQAPTTQSYDIELKYYTTAADENKVVEAVEGPDGAITRYIYWQGSALNRDINPDYLRSLILAPSWAENLIGAIRVDVVKPAYTALTSTTVAKFSGTMTVSHEITKG